MIPFAPGVDAQRGPAGLRESFMLESSVNYRGQTTLPDVVRDIFVEEADVLALESLNQLALLNWTTLADPSEFEEFMFLASKPETRCVTS